MNKVIFGLSLVLFLAAGNLSNVFASSTQETNKELVAKEKDKDKGKKKKKKCCAGKEGSEEKSCCKKDGEKKSCEGKK